MHWYDLINVLIYYLVQNLFIITFGGVSAERPIVRERGAQIPRMEADLRPFQHLVTPDTATLLQSCLESLHETSEEVLSNYTVTQLHGYIGLEAVEVRSSGYPTGQQASYCFSPTGRGIFYNFVSKPIYPCVTV